MTKKELEKKILELEKVLKTNGIEPKKDNLMTKVQVLESEAFNKAVGLIEACERMTGRKFPKPLPVYRKNAPDLPDIDLKLHDATQPLRNAVIQVAKFFKRNESGYSFANRTVFANWFRTQLTEELTRLNRAGTYR